MNSRILVVAAIIKKDEKYLITQRLPNANHFPNFWEFPGGKVDAGEELRACLEREIREELGIEIKAGEFFKKSLYRDLDLRGFYCNHISGEIQPIEIQTHKWVKPREMENYTFCPADLVFIEKLNEYKLNKSI